LNPKNIDFKRFFGDFWLQKSELRWMEIDYDYLRTGTAIGFGASHELYLAEYEQNTNS